ASNARDYRLCPTGPADNGHAGIFVPEQRPVILDLCGFDAYLPQGLLVFDSVRTVERSENDMTPFRKRLQDHEHARATCVAVRAGNSFVKDDGSRSSVIAIGSVGKTLQVFL